MSPLEIRKEFIEGSAIDLDLFEEAISLEDGELEIDPLTGEVTGTPIHDELDRKFTRFTPQARNLSLARFHNENGSVWMRKVFGLPKNKKGEEKQYLAPKGNGDQPYFPPVPQRLRELIAKINNLTPPSPEQPFWIWVLSHPQIPITLTEGGKKALAALSKGIVAIALYGCKCSGGKALKPFLRKRKIYIGLDKDTKESAKKDVAWGIKNLAWAIIGEKGEPRVLLWSSSQGKGLDDLAANGINLKVLCTDSQSLSFQEWNAKQRKETLDKYHPRKIKERYLSQESLNIPKDAQIVGIKSAKGTGKTEVLAGIVQEATGKGIPVIAIGKTIKLMVELAQRLGLDYRTDKSVLKHHLGYCLCINSLHPFAKPSFDPIYWGERGGIVVIDETDQVLWTLLNDDTLKDYRPSIINTLQTFLRKTLENGGKIYLADADLSSTSIDFILSLVGLPIDPYIVQNNYKSPVSRSLTSFESQGEWLDELIDRVKENHGKGTIFIATGSQKASSKFGTINLEKILGKIIPPEKILRIDSESISDPSHPAFNCADNLSEVISRYWVVIASPTLETGVSLTGNGFDSVWAIAQGTQTVNGVSQALARVRSDVPRFIFAPKFHNMTIGGGSDSPQELIKRENILISHTLRELLPLEVYPIDGTNPEILKAWANYASSINSDSRRYRDAILEKLEEEGYTVTHASKKESTSGKAQKEIKEESVRELCDRIAQAPNPDDIAYKKLQEQSEKTETERNIEAKGRLTRTYLTTEVTPPLVEKDLGGWLGQLTLSYYLTVGKDFLKPRDEKKLKQLGKENDGKVFSVDANRITLISKVQVLEFLDVPQFLDSDKEFTSEGLEEWKKEKILPYRQNLKQVLNQSFSEKDSPIAIAQLLVGKLGLKMKCHRRRVDGERVRFYRLETTDPDNRGEVFKRWFDRDLDSCPTPCDINIYIGGGGTA